MDDFNPAEALVVSWSRKVSSYVLFHMWKTHRFMLIERHKFYARQAETRLLGQFGDIESEAEQAAADWLEQSIHQFDPDLHDPGSYYEQAYDKSVELHQLLTEMRDNTLLSIVAGMFHEWDKQLRNWMVMEINHWHHGDSVRSEIWKMNFENTIDLLAGFGWNFRNKPFYQFLDACRLVVNVYKHGDGNSLIDLKKKYPMYLENLLKGDLLQEIYVGYVSHEDL